MPNLDKKKILIVVGHNEEKQGAAAASGFSHLTEHKYNLDLATALSCHLGNMGHEGFIFIKEPKTEFLDVVKMSNDIKPDCHIELHCNAYNKLVSGIETLYINHKRFAECLQCEMSIAIKLRNRGVKELNPRDRGYSNLSGVVSPCAIVEPFFIDNAHDCHFMQDKFDLLAMSISKGVEKWLQRL